MNQLNQSCARAAAVAVIENVHRGWAELIVTGKFLAWQHAQSPEVQALVNSFEPVDVIRLINLFLDDQTAPLKIH